MITTSTQSAGTTPRLRVAMVAYTRYRTDARVRRDAEALAERGDEVLCYCLRSSGAASQIVSGVKVVELPLRRYRGGSVAMYLLAYGLFMALAAVRLLFAHAARRIDVVHVHNLPDLMVFAAAPVRMLGARVILDIHDTTPETYAGKFGVPMGHPLIRGLGWQERACAAMAHRVIVPHELQRDVMVSRGTPVGKIRVVMNSPDERLFPAKEWAGRPSPASPGFHVIYHGTIAPRHGVDLLVLALIALLHEIPGLRLTVCGEGDHLPEVRRLAAGAPGSAVTITGMLPLEEMAARVSSADLEVIPLRSDAATTLQLSVKALEAMACGVPVACAENRALRHHFGDEAVMFFAPDDPLAIEEAIRSAHRDPEMAAARARRAASRLETYSWRRQKAVYLAIVDGLTGGVHADSSC